MAAPEFGNGFFKSQRVTLIAKNPISVSPTVVPLKEAQCCSDEIWRVLADENSTDEYKNDVNSFLWAFDKLAVTDATLVLLDAEDNEYDLTGVTTYGTPLDYLDSFNNQNESFVGYKIEWKKVLDLIGEGLYTVRCDIVTLFGDEQSLFADNYCLKQYTLGRADKTLRIEYYLNGRLGNNEFDDKVRDFAQLNWYNSHRFDGYFMFGSAEYKTDYIQYENGQRLFVEDDQEPEYNMELKPIPMFKHNLIRTDILMADKLLITDYNTGNLEPYVKKAVQKSSSYAPKFYPMRSKLGKLELKFKQEFNNHKKFRD